MKGKIGSIIVFVAAFAVVTALIIVLNGMFNNIFKFDFSSPVEIQALKSGVDIEKLAEIKQNIEENLREQYTDSLQTLKDMNEKADSSLSAAAGIMDSINILRKNLARLEAQKKEIESVAEVKKTENDPNLKYKEWLKNTISLYAVMESDQVAKIITKYSDNVARDLIYTMKKKKAAEVLASLNPEEVNRLIRVEQ